MSTLSGKVALVTGGSRGIGAATVRRLAADGADVAFTYRSSSDAAHALASEIEATGRRALAIQADAADAGLVRQAVQNTVDTLGRLDVLVNNAGIYAMGPVQESNDDDFDRMVDINVKAVFAATTEAVKHLGEGGRVITIGSVNGDRAFGPGAALYGMSKAAVAALTRGWARDLGEHGITVNTVQPGPVDTDMNPSDAPHAPMMTAMTALKRYGRAEEIAGLVGFLAGPEASFITGATIDADGGMQA
ncbi:MAG: 3-oxoacyl-ACP reductase family protein [Bacteroidota bacterium]